MHIFSYYGHAELYSANKHSIWFTYFKFTFKASIKKSTSSLSGILIQFTYVWEFFVVVEYYYLYKVSFKFCSSIEINECTYVKGWHIILYILYVWVNNIAIYMEFWGKIVDTTKAKIYLFLLFFLNLCLRCVRDFTSKYEQSKASHIHWNIYSVYTYILFIRISPLDAFATKI